MSFAIRDAVAGDRDAVVRIHTESCREIYADDLPAVFLREGLGPVLERLWEEQDVLDEDVFLVAEDEDGELLGFLAVWCRPEAYISNFHLDPTRRGGGIGTALLREGARRLLAGGRDSAYLWVATSNAAAIGFYEHLGGERRRVSDEDLFIHRAEKLRIEWPDLRVLLESA